MTLLLVVWTIVGLFVDIWSHGQPGLIETFFSPWHALFYTGYAATAVWLLYPLVDAIKAGKPARAGVPPGYGPGLVGLLIFALGGATDMAWHATYGFETSAAVQTSPPHFLLFVGLILIASCPFQAAWAAEGRERRTPRLGEFLPALLSVILATTVVAVTGIYQWGFTASHFATVESFSRIAREFPPERFPLVRDLLHARGIANIYLSTVVLLAPILVMLGRWRLPFGSVTVFWTVTVALMAAATGFFMLTILAVSLAGGLIADGLAGILDPSQERPTALRAFSALAPMALWGLYFLAVHVEWGLAWTPSVWAGVVLWSGMGGLGLSLVAASGR